VALILKYVSGKKNYFKDVLKIIKKSKKKICYVTLNKSCGSLKEAMKKLRINTKRFYFVDCISAAIRRPRNVGGCNFISAPYELDEIASSIKKAVKKGYILVIFDSLSNLLVYGQAVPAGADILIDFINSFSHELERRKGKAIFICKSSDKEKALIGETIPVFNKTIGG
jgi:hypothetical protein|tara:strand:+ start:140 stop:646 length:507 start_codon:yes stop_codon:yes gene_type:complete